MTRIEFIRSSGRWTILLLLMAAGGFLLASRRISLRNYCTSDPNCAGCGLKRVCRPVEENKAKSDEKE
jgi:hypothetical protein